MMLQKHGTEGKANRMSDLISREEALERLQILKKFNTAEIIQDVIDAAEQQINFCSTAFDKEKVIEKLKRLKKDTFNYYNRYNDEMAFGESAAFRSAIEIVEKGGVE